MTTWNVNFPRGLYADVRIEEASSTRIACTRDTVDEARERRVTAAFIRVWDGRRWYGRATSDMARLQQAVDDTAALARGRTGADDPVGIYYFKWTGEGFAKEVIDYGPTRVGTGVGIHFQVVDIDGNGRLDVVAPGKDGLYLFRNLGPAQPRNC